MTFRADSQTHWPIYISVDECGTFSITHLEIQEEMVKTILSLVTIKHVEANKVLVHFTVCHLPNEELFQMIA